VAENCTGTSAGCPPDAAQPDGTPCDDGGTCAAGVCETTTTTTATTTTTLQSCAPIANPDFFVTTEDASGLTQLGNKLSNDVDPCTNPLSVTDVNLAGTPITLVGTGAFTLADVSIVKIAAASGDVATFQVTTAAANDMAYIHIAANGNESLENNSDAFNAMTSGQSLTFHFTYSISDGQGGSSNGIEDVTINGVNDAPN